MAKTEAKVRLTGVDGNAFMVLGVTLRAMKKARVSKDVQDEFSKKAMSADYDHLLQTVMAYCEVS